MKAFLLFGCLMANVVAIRCEDDSEITKFMKHLNVIPDVIDEGPKDFLRIIYGYHVQADKGVELTPTQVKDQPTVEWAADNDSFFTLVMTDPDAPSREDPKFREFHHWLVVNIPGNDISKGEVLTEYVGSGPPKGTGLHRYVFLLYKQNGKLEFDEPKISKRSRKNRPNFSIRKFAKKHNLGIPIAGNFYQAQYDDYVPTIHEQLSQEN